METIIKYETPSHGYYVIPVKLWKKNKTETSEYSSYNKDTKELYLEEDCEGPAFLDRLEKNGIEFSITKEYKDYFNCRDYSELVS